jgi:hypothetical protein
MLPYLTVSSVVGVKGGTRSAKMPAFSKAERISAARVLDRNVVGQVDWRLSKKGDADTAVAARSR